MFRRSSLFACLAFALFALPSPAQPVPSLYVPLNPCRLFDSRLIGEGAPLAAETIRYFLVRGSCEVPQAANAVALTVVAYNPLGAGYVTVWEAGEAFPEASSFNFRSGPGSDSSFVLTPLCPAQDCEVGEEFAIYVSQQTGIIVDVAGYTIPLPPVDSFPAE